jgi:transposase
MPRPFLVEFRQRAVALVRAGKPVTAAAAELGVSAAAIHSWVRQDQIDRGERPGVTTPESIELAKAKKRIRQLETAVKILKTAAKLAGEARPGPKRIYPVIDLLVHTVTGKQSVGHVKESTEPTAVPSGLGRL